MVNPDGGGAEQRVFIDLGPALNRSYSMTPIPFTTDFEIDIEFSTTSTSLNLISAALPAEDGIYIDMNAGAVRTFVYVGTDNTGTLITTAATLFNDGKLNRAKVKLVGSVYELFVNGVSYGTSTVNLDGNQTVSLIGLRGTTFSDGILANPVLNNGTIISWNLDEATANTETNNEGGKDLTYNNIATSKRELYQLSGDQTQWDNISPPVQQLPSVIEIP